MRCSKKGICKYPCPGRTLPSEFSALITSGLEQSLENNQLPASLAIKIAQMLEASLDAADFCDKVFLSVDSQLPVDKQLPAKIRLLDRAIVNRFETLYDLLSVELDNRSSTSIDLGNFFNAIPRGECLDLFLQLIKEHCIGDQEILIFERKMMLLTDRYTINDKIDWDNVYQSNEYEQQMNSFFSLFFKRIKDNEIAIPALNNKLSSKYNPQRINKLLKYMSKVWEINHQKVS